VWIPAWYGCAPRLMCAGVSRDLIMRLFFTSVSANSLRLIYQ
jgi:hypothetical protein